MSDTCVIVGADWGGLAVAESLHAVGVRTLVIRTRPQEVAHLSRFADRSLTVSTIDPASPDLLDFLLRATDWHGGSLVATTDGAVEYLCRHHDTLSERYRIWHQDWESTAALLDKQRLYRRAARLGIPIPRTVEVPLDGEPTAELADLAVPVIVKPCRGHEFFARFRAKMFVARDDLQLRTAMRLAREAGLAVIVSEIVPGDDDALFQCRVYLDRDGQSLGEVHTRKIRQHPPGFGCGRVSRTVPPVEEMRDATLELLQSCHYRGFAHAEFKRDPRDGEYKLIEVNVRPPAMQRVATAAGVNFAQIAHLDHVHGVSNRVVDYEKGVHWIDLFQDPLGWIRWRNRENRPNGGYFRPYIGRRVFNVQPFADPLPFLAKSWQLVRQAPGFIRSRRDAVAGPLLSSRGADGLMTVPVSGGSDRPTS